MALVALGVTGGISAYKAVEVARGLQQHGHEVTVIMTRAAQRFVGPLTFEAITQRRVITRQFERGASAEIEHVSLASQIALLVVAPATANCIGKFAAGIADDFLSTFYLATRATVLIAPAMNTVMWEHPALVRNLAILRERGVHVVEPAEGYLACGWTGKGRLPDPAAIVEAALALIAPRTSLSGRRILVTAGPTYEDLDPVRFLGNRSSGRMGFALAREAQQRGAQVVLVSGPTALEPPPVSELVRVRSAADMHRAVLSRAADMDVIVMAAAVADYTPAQPMVQKIIKSREPLTVTFEPTADILGDLGRMKQEGVLQRPLLVGFAAETSEVAARARAKRSAKHADLIVANDVSARDAGFEVETNRVMLIGEEEEMLPLLLKRDVAAAILDRVERLLAARQAG